MDEEAFLRVARAGELLFAAQSRILAELITSRPPADVLAMFGADPARAHLVDWHELVAGERIVARLDVLPTAEGYRICEMNVDTPIGGLELFHAMEAYCAELEWWPLRRNGVPHRDVVSVVARTARARSAERIVVLDWDSLKDSGYFGFDLLREYIAEELPDLDVRLVYHGDYDPAWLSPEEGARTLVYRGFMYSDVDDWEFVDRLHASGATILNSYESEVRSSKVWFALFRDPRFARLLDDATRDAIAEFVPFSVLVNDSNESDVLARREDYLFKPPLASGGHGIVVGADHPEPELRRLIRSGDGPWVAQRLLDTWVGTFAGASSFEPVPQQNVVLGLYLIDGSASGLMVRASEERTVVNASGTVGWAMPLSAADRRLFGARLLGRPPLAAPGPPARL
jgi:hypothetical protein